MKMSVRKLVLSAAVAALYATLTLALAPISYGPIQFRIAEVLCILPFFLPFSVWGLFVGCVIANLFSQFGILDIVFGGFATLLGAWLTAQCGIRGRARIGWKLLACLSPVLCNGVIVGAVLAAAGTPEVFWLGWLINGLQVAGGEAAVLFCLGLPLLLYLPKTSVYRRLCHRYGLESPET